MNTITSTPVRVNSLGIASIVLAILGGGFYFWVPLGMVLSVAGLLTGVTGWVMARRESRGWALLIVGILLSIAALGIDFYIARSGMEVIELHATR